MRPYTLMRVTSKLWPPPRNAEDLGVFLQTDIVASVVLIKAVRGAFDRLGFTVVERVRFMHFKKSPGAVGQVKADPRIERCSSTPAPMPKRWV